MKKEYNLQSILNFRIGLCMFLLLLLSIPVLYYITRNYYAEDIEDIVIQYNENGTLPEIDLEEDIREGMLLQLILSVVSLCCGLYIVTVWISHSFWQSFEKTLKHIADFRLESGVIPPFEESDVREFNQLNRQVIGLMQNNLSSYKAQKEFTENASHELQTPIAVMQSKLDLLLQTPGLSEEQMKLIESLNEETHNVSRLSRSLLLLSKIENHQYHQQQWVDVSELLTRMDRKLHELSDKQVSFTMTEEPVRLLCNESLLESLIRNLSVNALRYGDDIKVSLTQQQFEVSDRNESEALDSTRIFERFYRSETSSKGHGLGLAIAKAICQYYQWEISYRYEEGRHIFHVQFATDGMPSSRHTQA